MSGKVLPVPLSRSEALDVLYQAMSPESYHRIRLAIEIASDSPAIICCR